MPAPIPFPPGDTRREDLRLQLRSHDATTLHVAFESRQASCHLLSYRLEPGRRLDASATAELRELVLAQIRLILLTGCRKGEILSLAWSSYREGKLFLPDSKTGPRTIWLSSAARTVLDALPRRRRLVFPGRRARPLVIDRVWQAMRAEAGLDDVRLHDLRHSYASVAMLRGETVLTIGRLLGHNHPTTTLKYVHLSDDAAR